jgi:hypothetical protein
VRFLQLSILTFLIFTSSRAGAAEQEATPDSTWWQRINLALDEIAAPYKIVPPTPVTVRWQATKIWSGVLPGEVVGMMGVDLGDDGKSELVALTNRQILVFSQKRGLFDIRMQATLPDKPARTRSRDPIGSLSSVSVGDSPIALRVRSSDQTVGARFTLVGNTLTSAGEFPGYPLCGQGTIYASRGRNYFSSARASWPKEDPPSGWAQATETRALAEKLYSLQCSESLPDSEGRATRYLSGVSVSGELSLYCQGDAAHCAAMTRTLSDVGDAHLLADVNNDGFPEIFYSARGAPGAPDRLVVLGHDALADAPMFQHEFSGGIVALAAGDFAGDGALEVIVAVRKPLTKKVTLWLLN